jgi:hypothetical protein
MSYRLHTPALTATYPMRIVDGVLYAQRPHSATWYATVADAGNWLYPATRLQLLAEALQVARSETVGGLRHVSRGFAREYVFSLSPDQLMQLNGFALAGSDETSFARSATGEVHLYPALQGGTLLRIEVQLTSTEPATGVHRSVTCGIDLLSGPAAAVVPPAQAQPVTLQQFFSG